MINPSIKHNTYIGIFLSTWIFIFAFFIRPFDDETLNLKLWIRISIGFSVITFLCYYLVALFQKYLYKKIAKWDIGQEILILLLFHILYLITTYLYYISPIFNGSYTFYEFFTIIIVKVALITTPILVLARKYAIKLIPTKKEVITIKGENKLDILKIKKSDLICITNAQNYIEILYLQNNQLQSKLIRYSLKKIENDLDFLIKVHRSYLINPSHFKSWKNQKIIILTQMEVPVSKNNRDKILSL